MGNPYFQFKQFTLWQRHAPLKVGTDGVVLGAWALRGLDPLPAYRFLDVGCGTGVIALMLAQRFPHARVEGVELVEEAAREAAENAALSPWPRRVEIFCGDFAAGMPPGQGLYDALVSNPPFFVNDLHAATEAKTLARHCTHLSHPLLVQRAAELLKPGGRLALVLPPQEALVVEAGARTQGFVLRRHTRVLGKETKKTPLRVLLEWEKTGEVQGEVERDVLPLTAEDGRRHPAYQDLARDFYLY